MNTTLCTETTGHGPDLFLVHGWAFHSGVWKAVVARLAQTFRVTCVDLPGHGLSRELPMPMTLPELARQLVDAAPKNAVWLGWSLGGLTCLRAALDFPWQLRALLLVSTTPRFVTASDWLHAMPLTQLQEFVAELGHAYRKTVQRFLSLQLRGDKSPRTSLRQLREVVFARSEPHLSSLVQGLELLRDSDLRAELGRILLPTLVIVGDYDQLTPPQAGAALATAIHGAELLRLPHAAHVPFISHPAEFITAVERFMQKLSGMDRSENRP